MRKFNIFNLNRFFLLLKKDFYTQYKTYLIALGAIFSVLFIVNIASIASAKYWNFNLVFYPLTLFIGGFIFTSLSFSELSEDQSRTFYFTLPASNLEKFISRLLITSIEYVIVSLMLYFIFSVVMFTLTEIIFGIGHSIFNPFNSTIWLCIRIYIVTQSVFLLGGVYFRKNALIKTILTVFVVSLFYTVFIAGVGYIFIKIISINNQIYFSFKFLKIFFQEHVNMPDSIINYVNIINLINKIFFWFILAPLFWVISFIHLKELEV